MSKTRENVFSLAELPGKPSALGWKEELAGFIRPLINQQSRPRVGLPALIAPGRNFLPVQALTWQLLPWEEHTNRSVNTQVNNGKKERKK